MELKLKHRITFFDLETGGLSPRKHPIIQIAAVQVNHDFSAYRSFEVKVQFDERQAEQQALNVNSYEPDVWAREAVSPRQAAEKFKKFISGAADIERKARSGRSYYVAQLAAHNAEFDKGFLFPWYKSMDIFLPADYHVMDTIQLAMLHRSIYGTAPKSLKLGDLCDYYDVDLVDAHDALGDVMATAKLARKLMAQLQLG